MYQSRLKIFTADTSLHLGRDKPLVFLLAVLGQIEW